MSNRPNCIVWAPILPIGFLFPFIGHVGITDSNGTLYEFAGTRNVRKNDQDLCTIFGNATKVISLQITDYSKIDEESIEETLDQAIALSTNKFKKKNFNFLTNNCHNFVADVLDKSGYKEKKNWNSYSSIKIAWFVLKGGKLIGVSGFIKSYLGFFILITIIILFIVLK
ncbi:transmembrane protein [Anaeramoeba flamelloides]|uniref:Transmembrane protein n=1 Tax=Anaeramoeba flamelloides TaxID=1746091 RepID=A0ABQ8YE23_9EUKA|nr:transmembrane protein [Anaeramoeba flamelloides]